jgi:hypothetical protein
MAVTTFRPQAAVSYTGDGTVWGASFTQTVLGDGSTAADGANTVVTPGVAGNIRGPLNNPSIVGVFGGTLGLTVTVNARVAPVGNDIWEIRAYLCDSGGTILAGLTAPAYQSVTLATTAAFVFTLGVPTTDTAATYDAAYWRIDSLNTISMGADNNSLAIQEVAVELTYRSGATATPANITRSVTLPAVTARGNNDTAFPAVITRLFTLPVPKATSFNAFIAPTVESRLENMVLGDVWTYSTPTRVDTLRSSVPNSGTITFTGTTLISSLETTGQYVRLENQATNGGTMPYVELEFPNMNTGPTDLVMPITVLINFRTPNLSVSQDNLNRSEFFQSNGTRIGQLHWLASYGWTQNQTVNRWGAFTVLMDSQNVRSLTTWGDPLWLRLRPPNNFGGVYVDIYDVKLVIGYGNFPVITPTPATYGNGSPISVITGAVNDETTLPTTPVAYDGDVALKRRDANSFQVNGTGWTNLSNNEFGRRSVKMQSPTVLPSDKTTITWKVTISTYDTGSAATTVQARLVRRTTAQYLAGNTVSGTSFSTSVESQTITTTAKTWTGTFAYFNKAVNGIVLDDWDGFVIEFWTSASSSNDGQLVTGVEVIFTTTEVNNAIGQPATITRQIVLPVPLVEGSGGADGTRAPDPALLTATPLVPALLGNFVQSTNTLTLTGVDSRDAALSGIARSDATVSNTGTVSSGTAHDALASGSISLFTPGNTVLLDVGEVCIVELSTFAGLAAGKAAYALWFQWMFRFEGYTGDVIDDGTDLLVDVTDASGNVLAGFDVRAEYGFAFNNFTYYSGVTDTEKAIEDDSSPTVWMTAAEIANLRTRFELDKVFTVGTDDNVSASLGFFDWKAFTFEEDKPIGFYRGWSFGQNNPYNILNFNMVTATNGLASNTESGFLCPIGTSAQFYGGQGPIYHAFELGGTIDAGFLYAQSCKITYNVRINTSTSPTLTMQASYKIMTSTGVLLAAADAAGTYQAGAARVGNSAAYTGLTDLFFDWTNKQGTKAQWDDAWLHIKVTAETPDPPYTVSSQYQWQALYFTLYGGTASNTGFPARITTPLAMTPVVALGSGDAARYPNVIETTATELAPAAAAGSTLTPPALGIPVLVITPAAAGSTDATLFPDVVSRSFDLLPTTVTTQQDANVFGFLLELDFNLPAPSKSVGSTLAPATIPIFATPLAVTPRAGAQVFVAATSIVVVLNGASFNFSYQANPATIAGPFLLPEAIRRGGGNATSAVLEALLTNPPPSVSTTSIKTPGTVTGAVSLPPAVTTDQVNTTRAAFAIEIRALTQQPSLFAGLSNIARPTTAAILATMAQVVASAGQRVLGLGVIITNLTTFTPAILRGASSSPGSIVSVIALNNVTATGAGITGPSTIAASAQIPNVFRMGGATLTPPEIDATVTSPAPFTQDGISARPVPNSIPVTGTPLFAFPSISLTRTAPMVAVPISLLIPSASGTLTATPTPATVLTAAALNPAVLRAGMSAAPTAIISVLGLDPATVRYGQTATPSGVTCTVSMGTVDITAGISNTIAPAVVLSQLSFPSVALSGASTAKVAQIATTVLLQAVQTGYGRNVDVSDIQVTLTPLQVAVYNIPDVSQTVNVATIHAVATFPVGNVLTFVDVTIEIVVADADSSYLTGMDWGVRPGGAGQTSGKTPGPFSGGQTQFGSGGGGYFEGT